MSIQINPAEVRAGQSWLDRRNIDRIDGEFLAAYCKKNDMGFKAAGIALGLIDAN